MLLGDSVTLGLFVGMNVFGTSVVGDRDGDFVATGDSVAVRVVVEVEPPLHPTSTVVSIKTRKTVSCRNVFFCRVLIE